MHSSFAPLKSLLQSSKPGSSSVFTLPQLFLLLFVLALILVIVSVQLAELKLLILNRLRRWFHSSRVKLPLSVSASWFFMSTYLIWILWVRVDSVQHPIKCNSMGSGHVSHWSQAFDDHLDHRFLTFKNVKHGARTRRFRV